MGAVSSVLSTIASLLSGVDNQTQSTQLNNPQPQNIDFGPAFTLGSNEASASSAYTPYQNFSAPCSYTYPGPGSVEAQLLSQGQTWSDTSAPITPGTYVQDILPDRQGQPAERGMVGTVVSTSWDASTGQMAATVDFGRGYTVGINFSELSSINVEPAASEQSSSGALELSITSSTTTISTSASQGAASSVADSTSNATIALAAQESTNSASGQNFAQLLFSISDTTESISSNSSTGSASANALAPGNPSAGNIADALLQDIEQLITQFGSNTNAGTLNASIPIT